MFMIFGLGFFLLKWIILFLLLIYTLETMVPDLSKKKYTKRTADTQTCLTDL